LDGVLSSVASSISDSLPVAWDRLAQELAGDDEVVLEELRLLDRIARFHDGSRDLVGPAVAAPDSGSAADDNGPRRWAHFLILGRISSGPFADVYRAHDTKLQCDVALTLMRAGEAAAADRARLIRDLNRIARVRHANLMASHGVDEADGRVGMWMELVRGTTLEELLRRQGSFDAHGAALICLELCRAVAALHRAGVQHRDIRTRSVMRDEAGRTVLMGVGGGSDVGDVYGVGVVLFQLVTNRDPVDGQTASQLRQVCPELPEEFIAIVLRALEKDPGLRFPTAQSFEGALADFLGVPAEQAQERRRWPSWIATLASRFQFR
jgi:serine/threonine protein kinase